MSYNKKDFPMWKLLDNPQVVQHLREHYAKKGFLHGVELCDFLIKDNLQQLNLQNNNSELIEQAFLSGFRTDPSTGSVVRDWERLFRSEAENYANNFSAANNDPVSVVDIDFTNISNANLVLGRDQVTRAMAIITKICQDALTKPKHFLQARANFFGLHDTHCVDYPTFLSPKAANGTTCFRMGGDELRMFVTGLNQHDLEDRLHYAERETMKFIADLGVKWLEHHKNDKSPGFGVGYGFAMVSGSDNEKIYDSLDMKVEVNKEKIAQHKFLDFFGGRDNSLSQQLTQKHVVGRRGDQPVSSPEELAKDLSPAQVEKVLQHAETAFDVKQAHKVVAWPSELLLPIKYQDSLFDNRIHAAGIYAQEHDFDVKQADFLKLSADIFNSIDSVSGLKAPHMFAEALAQSKAAPHTILLTMEVTNIRGLNIIGHMEANKIIELAGRTITNCVAKHLGVAAAKNLFCGGGGHVRLLYNFDEADIAAQMEKVQAMLQDAGERIAKLNELSLDDVKLRVGDVEHPSKDNIEKGVSLVFAAIEVPKDIKIPKGLESDDFYALRVVEKMADSHARVGKTLEYSQMVGQMVGDSLAILGNNIEGRCQQIKGVPEEIHKNVLEHKREKNVLEEVAGTSVEQELSVTKNREKPPRHKFIGRMPDKERNWVQLSSDDNSFQERV